MFLPSLIPWRIVAEVAVAGIAIAGAFAMGHHDGDSAGYKRGRLEVQSAWDQDRKLQLAAAIKSSEEQRSIEAQREQAKQESINEATRLESRARESQLRVAAGDQRMHDAALAAFRASCSQARQDPIPARAGPAASEPGELFADVLGSLRAEARRYAALADAALTAGEACERSYDSLTPEQER